jgi:Protein of unknown function (DUF2934)
MSERLVDMLNVYSTVIHTLPIMIEGSDTNATDAEYEVKGLEEAAHAYLVPDAELRSLVSRILVGRGGTLAPYGHDHDAVSQTREALNETVRRYACHLWQREGCPEGRSDEFWNRAHEQHLRERAYFLWWQASSPDGRFEEFWHQTAEFELY